MTSQVEGLNQAIRNANDGAALIQTAEGGLEEMTNILQRMRELSIQSANGTYDTGNRDTLNAEVEQLQQEIDRISETTSFNGLNILDGSNGEIKLQVGENANQTISLEIGELNTKNLGTGTGADIVGAKGTSTVEAAFVATADGTAAVQINGVNVEDMSNETTLKGVIDKLNNQITSVTADTLVEFNATTKGTGIISAATPAAGLTLTITNKDESTTALNITSSSSMDDLIAQINERGEGAITASLNDDGYLTLASTGTASIGITGTGATAAVMGTGMAVGTTENARLTLEAKGTQDSVTVSFDTQTDALVFGVDNRIVAGQIIGNDDAAAADFNAGDMIINGVELDKYSNTQDYSGDGTAGDNGDLVAFINTHSDQTGVIASLDISGSGEQLMLQSEDGSEISVKYRDGQEAAMLAITNIQETNDAQGAGGSVKSIDISTAEGAQKAISILDEAIQQVSEVRGDLGAVSNRLDHTTRNLANISENAAAARSQIMDADFAAESANLSRAQVLQQAGNAMLAQANSRPQQVLSLLQ
jgi:flagellin